MVGIKEVSEFEATLRDMKGTIHTVLYCKCPCHTNINTSGAAPTALMCYRCVGYHEGEK